jgi:hypothetical protein
MAVESNLTCINVTPDSDLSAKQYYLAKITSTGCALAAADTDPAYPIQNKPKPTGEQAVLAIAGVSKVIAGGAITQGAKVAPTAANGKAQAAASGDRWCGIALEAAGADGDIISILLHDGEILA